MTGNKRKTVNFAGKRFLASNIYQIDMKKKTISGFSKLSKRDKMAWVANNFFSSSEEVTRDWVQFWRPKPEEQKVIDGFSENTISNYVLPYGVAPNFSINGKIYTVPMVIEESSVVAAAASAAKFWLKRGGFRAEVISTIKLGQVHFSWSGEAETLLSLWDRLKSKMLKDAANITANMEKRGGGVLGIELLNMTDLEADYYQLRVAFETCDSMGANFINSVLESFALSLEEFMSRQFDLPVKEREVEIIMAILSNYTPRCLVRAWVECPVEDLKGVGKNISGAEFARKFSKAIRIAHIDPYRAATHNKGIFNGIDAVVLATANDFRAIEACGHAYAARDGQYRSLSSCTLENGIFRFWLDIPLALGTVGGLTQLHPLANRSLELLGRPSARELMQIVAVTGLAQNFAALRSLVTTGIQKGHMKMHLKNILNHLGATEKEIKETFTYFQNRVVSFSAVRDFLSQLRDPKQQVSF